MAEWLHLLAFIGPAVQLRYVQTTVQLCCGTAWLTNATKVAQIYCSTRICTVRVRSHVYVALRCAIVTIAMIVTSAAQPSAAYCVF